MKVLDSIYGRIQRVFKSWRNANNRRRLTNQSVTIISNHCMGGFIYHDLGLQFTSPTINLKIVPDEFIELVEHLDYYLKQEILPCPEATEPYPVGKIPLKNGDGYIYIYFVHYKSFEEGVTKWISRSKRVNWNNIVVLLTARDGCKKSTLKRFEELPYKQRICFTNEPYSEYPHCKYARLDNGQSLGGYISDMVNVFGKRAFECNGFDYVEFLNGKSQLPYY